MIRFWISLVLIGVFGCSSTPNWVSGLDGLSVNFPYRDRLTRNAVIGTLRYTGYSYLDNVEMSIGETLTDATIIANNSQQMFSRPINAYVQLQQSMAATLEAERERAKRKAQGLPAEPEPVLGTCLLLHFVYSWELDGRYATLAVPMTAMLPVEFNIRGSIGWTLYDINEAQRKVHGADVIASPKMEINTDYEFVAMLTPADVAHVTYRWRTLAETGKRLRLGISNEEGRELKGGSMHDAPLP